MAKITVEIDDKYREHLDLIKEMFPDEEGNKISNDGQVVEELIESFMVFLKQQQEAAASQQCCSDDSCCG
jgi:hypothetical protein